MYLEHFRLKEPPFSLSPDPRFLFMSERHREGMAHLFYGIQQPGGFVLLTGEIGSGKTTLCRSLVKQLPLETDVALILNPRLTVVELLASICDEVGASCPVETRSIKILVDALNRRLLEAFAQGRRTVLIIDEAQNLHPDVLEQIRLLTNLETSREKLLQIVLLGQPELLRILRQKGLMQLAQRITARYHLLPLSRSETFAYVRHRLSVAGRKDAVFTIPAMHNVHRFSRGVPRLINIICDRALLGAYSRDKRRVSAGIVGRAHKETRGFVPWYRRGFPTWGAGYAGLAILTVGGALYFGAGNLLMPRRAASENESAAQADRSEPSSAGIPVKSDTQVKSKADAAADADPGTRDSGLDPRSTQAPAVEAPKAGEVAPQLAQGAAHGAASAVPRLAELLSDPSLRGADASSFANLYARLGLKVPAGHLTDVCKEAVDQGFDCLYRVGNWTKLRHYDLPAILDLTLLSGRKSRVTLVGLGEDSATLSIGGREYTFPLKEIDSLWDGSFTLLWKLPFPARRIALGERGADVAWIRRTLDALEGRPHDTEEVDTFDESLRQRVMAFQKKQSLPQDGMVGNATLMRLSLAAMGPDAPSLSRHGP